MRRAWAGWRLAIRLAARDAWRAKVRSLLALAMVTLPVLGVTCAAVLISTSRVNTAEGLDRRLGAAQAEVTVPDGQAAHYRQGVDPYNDGYLELGRLAHKATLADVRRVLGERPALPFVQSAVMVRTEAGEASVVTDQLDLTDPLASGLFRLTAGRWPASTDEVVVNGALADRGPGLGGTLTLVNRDGSTVRRHVVGLAESTAQRTTAMAEGPIGSLPDDPGVYSEAGTSWLVGGGPVTWAQVQRLNAIGVVAYSRHVALDPPPVEPIYQSSTDRSRLIAIVGLIVAMIVIEVVLLAGPAFAVGAKRQSRALALVAANGGTPRQARRIVLASGLVVGAVASVVGVTLGIGLARALVPVTQRVSASWLGPFEIPWLELLGVVAFGVLSALLAVIVPAFIASRQDVVAVLAGRRGDRRPSRRNPVIGVAVLAIGVLLSWQGATGKGDLFMGAGAIVCVLGMLFVVPLAVVGAARLGSRLPLPLRFAVRDAARHRSRTVPAVAAVAATVAGVVALGIAVSSDEQQNRETYTPQLPMGMGMVSSDVTSPDWADLRARVLEHAPTLKVNEVEGADTEPGQGPFTEFVFGQEGRHMLSAGWGGPVSSSVLVSSGSIPTELTPLLNAQRAAVVRTLAAGGAVVFASEPSHGDTVTVVAHRHGDAEGSRAKTSVTSVSVPAIVVNVGNAIAPVQALVSPAVMRQLAVPYGTVALSFDAHSLSSAAEENVKEALAAAPTPGSIYVEHGYQAASQTVILQIVLAALGAVLMLGGTLTATFLALSDARPDLATLGAVGAAPRLRRAVAASYALAVGVVGALLGAAVGLVPGIAVSYPLTSTGDADGVHMHHYLDIPWPLLAGLVVGLPLVVAVVVALTTRSRLPMVARLE